MDNIGIIFIWKIIEPAVTSEIIFFTIQSFFHLGPMTLVKKTLYCKKSDFKMDNTETLQCSTEQ